MADFIANSFVLFLFVYVTFSFVKGFINPDPEKIPAWLADLFNGRIELGYIDDGEPEPEIELEVSPRDKVSELKEQVEILKLKKQLKELKEEATKPTVDNKLLKECVDILVSLGEKRSEAKKKAKDFLQDNPDATVDDFVSKIYEK
tara:strand:- start:134 stop:571 length:438 start_codon:yes stop_codon:yes gene_type:complete